MKHLKKSLLAMVAVLGMTSVQSHAALLTTPLQTQSYSGAAGNASGTAGVLPFLFNKFDSALGTLRRVVMRATFNISGGLISADNMTNQVATGTGYLGASVDFSSSALLINSSYRPMFSGFELTQFGNFTLAPDPTMSVGGNGTDVGTIYGGNYSMNSGWQVLAELFQDDFIGTVGQHLAVDFDTNSEVGVNVVGARGSFESVNTTVSMELFYEYETVDGPAPVSAPMGFAALGLGLIGFAARRKKQ